MQRPCPGADAHCKDAKPISYVEGHRWFYSDDVAANLIPADPILIDLVRFLQTKVRKQPVNYPIMMVKRRYAFGDAKALYSPKTATLTLTYGKTKKALRFGDGEWTLTSHDLTTKGRFTVPPDVNVAKR
jgi:hypothetical protein